LKELQNSVEAALETYAKQKTKVFEAEGDLDLEDLKARLKELEGTYPCRQEHDANKQMAMLKT